MAPTNYLLALQVNLCETRGWARRVTDLMQRDSSYVIMLLGGWAALSRKHQNEDGRHLTLLPLADSHPQNLPFRKRSSLPSWTSNHGLSLASGWGATILGGHGQEKNWKAWEGFSSPPPCQSSSTSTPTLKIPTVLAEMGMGPYICQYIILFMFGPDSHV